MLFAALVNASLIMSPAWAADPSTYTITSENDSPWSLMWNNPYRDEYYTNGIRLSRSQDVRARSKGSIAALTKLLGMTDPEQLHFALAQSMYTPVAIWEPAVPEGAHPYAGHLFATAGLSASRPHLLASAEVLVGWTGPPALGEPAQTWVHANFNGYEPLGWHEQVPFEPTFGTNLNLAAHELIRASTSPVELRAVPHSMLTLATTDLAAQVGGLVGIGTRGDVPALRPEQVRFGHGGIDTYLRGESRMGVSVFAHTSYRFQAHDMFVAGGTFTEIDAPTPVGLVHESGVGVSVRIFGTRLLMMNNWQSRTFETQERDHIYGTMAIAQQM